MIIFYNASRKNGTLLCAGYVSERRRDQCGVAVLHHRIEVGRNVVLGLEIVRCVVAAEFDFHRGHSFYCAAMVLARAISRFWMLLSPPQRNSTTEGPRRIK